MRQPIAVAVVGVSVLLIAGAAALRLGNHVPASDSAPTSTPAPQQPRDDFVVYGTPYVSVPNDVEPAPKWRLLDENAGGELINRDDSGRTWESRSFTMRRPEEVPDLPSSVREVLGRLECRIPQSLSDEAPHNLLWGEFERRGQRDLLVLCARDSDARAYIFWNAVAERVAMLPFGGAGDTITIGTAPDIERHADPDARLDATMPRALDHDAIEVGCCECCSSFFYLHQGRWFVAPGAD
jgi:hypothetical protein